MNNFRSSLGIFKRLANFNSSLVNIQKKMMHISKLESTHFKDLITPELQSLVDIFNRNGHEIRICGGAVRDLLMNIKPHDIDFSTPATPQEMVQMFDKEGVRILLNNGEKHGTITTRINDKDNFEITSLRLGNSSKDFTAPVQFTKNWEEDASRRDLTINAMYLDFEGNIYDYFNGKQDLAERKIIFVNDPKERIQDDYLRILRYFRFYGQVATDPNAHDEKSLQAIKDNLEGLTKIAGERIWHELKKILMGNHTKELLNTMVDCGLGPFVGLPEKPNLQEFNKVYQQAIPHEPNPMTLMTALCNEQNDLFTLFIRIKPSNFEKQISEFLLSHRDYDNKNEKELNYYKKLILIEDIPNIRSLIAELFKYKGMESISDLATWTPPPFPMNGYILKQNGYKQGPMFSTIIANLKGLWFDSNYTLNEEQLLEKVPSIIENQPKIRSLKYKRKYQW